MMDIEGDIVLDLLRKVLEYAAKGDGSFTEQMALQVEEDIRHQYGGDEVYVKQTSTLNEMRQQERRKKVHADLRSGKKLDEVSKTHGISRRTIYRLMGKGE